MSRSHSRERGAALISILMLSSVLMAAAVLMSRVAGTELQIAANEVRAGQALALADAGVNHAMALMLDDVADGFDDELSGAGTGGGLVALGSLESLDGVAHRFQAHDGAPDGYYVRVTDNHDETSGADDPTDDTDNYLNVVSEARHRGAVRRIEARVRAVLGAACGILTEDDLEMSGTTDVRGNQGCAHTNGDLSANGDPTVEQAATSSGTMTLTGNPSFDGENLGSGEAVADYVDRNSLVPALALPTVNVLGFGPDAIDLAAAVQTAGGYRLDEDCRVYQGGTWACGWSAPYCSGGTEVGNGSGGGWNGWKCSSTGGSTPGARWKVGGNSAVNGAFFVEGWVDISGSPGSIASPWETTIIAMNSIDVGGSPVMVPFTTTGTLRNILLVSGNDVTLRGNLGATGRPAAVFAHQQFKTNGTVDLLGFIVAEGGASTWPGDPAPTATSGRDLISPDCRTVGTVNITNVGVDTGLVRSELRLLSWKELRQGTQ